VAPPQIPLGEVIFAPFEGLGVAGVAEMPGILAIPHVPKLGWHPMPQ
jgi:hypothetical protein